MELPGTGSMSGTVLVAVLPSGWDEEGGTPAHSPRHVTFVLLSLLCGPPVPGSWLTGLEEEEVVGVVVKG